MTDLARCAGTTAAVCQHCRRRDHSNWLFQPHVLHQPEANNWCSLYIEPQPISVSNNTGVGGVTRIYLNAP